MQINLFLKYLSFTEYLCTQLKKDFNYKIHHLILKIINCIKFIQYPKLIYTTVSIKMCPYSSELTQLIHI